MLRIFAGLAVLTAANEQFDDDDLNFLRMLSSNASSNSSGGAASTAAPMMNQTTTMAVTTTPMADNVTTTAAVTTTPMADSNVTTTVAVTTTGAGGDAPTTTAASNNGELTAICSAKAYEMAGGKAPSPMDDTKMTAMKDKVYFAACSKVESDGSVKHQEVENKDHAFYQVRDPLPTDNDKMCHTDDGFKVSLNTCSNSNGLETFKSSPKEQQRYIVEYCCGAGSGFEKETLTSPETTGTFTWKTYKTSGCASGTETSAATELPYEEQQLLGSTVDTFKGMRDFTLGSCNDVGAWKGGPFLKIPMCNGTDGTGSTEMWLLEQYYDKDCTSGMLYYAHPMKMEKCGASEEGHEGHDHDRRLSGNDTEIAFYRSHTCAATAPSTMKFETVVQATLGGLSALTETQKCAVGTTATTKATAVFKETVTTGTVTDSHAYSGAFETCARRRSRQLSSRLSRRLTGDTGSFVSTFTVTVAYADAQTVQDAVTAATTGGGALDVSTLKSTIETHLQTDPATKDIPGIDNITATVTPVEVGVLVEDTTGTTGSTSGAFISTGAFAAVGAFVVAAFL